MTISILDDHMEAFPIAFSLIDRECHESAGAMLTELRRLRPQSFKNIRDYSFIT